MSARFIRSFLGGALPQLSALIFATTSCGDSSDFDRHDAPGASGAAGAPLNGAAGATEAPETTAGMSGATGGAPSTSGATTGGDAAGLGGAGGDAPGLGAAGGSTGGDAAGAGGAASGTAGSPAALAGAAGLSGAPAGHAGAAAAGASAGSAGSAGATASKASCGTPLARALYVDAQTGNDNADCGTPTSPCRTVRAGVLQAKLNGAPGVVIGAGVYVESVELNAPMELVGGWRREGTRWVALCPDEDPSGAVTLLAPSNESRTITVRDAGGRVRIAQLSVTSKASASPGESLYGIFATGASTDLVLDNVHVWLAPAGAGDPGGRGADGASGATSCPAGDGATGQAGAAAPLTRQGMFEGEGYVPADGMPGVSGERGHDGPNGNPSASSNCANTDGYTCTKMTVRAVGLPGCGGLPGQGGTPGKGGGSSVGLFAWDTTVVVRGGQFAAGDGGDGGPGGEPGLGGPGSTGASDTALCAARCDYISGLGRYVLAGGTRLTSSGTAGGAGGPGSQGGQGAGGHSYAIYGGGRAQIELLDAALIAGQPGAGETPGVAAEKNF